MKSAVSREGAAEHVPIDEVIEGFCVAMSMICGFVKTLVKALNNFFELVRSLLGRICFLRQDHPRLGYGRPPTGGRNCATTSRHSLSGGIPMLRFITILAVLVSAQAAVAQNQPPPAYMGGGGAPTPPTDLPSGIGNYCIYENLIYSIGSPLCVGKTSYLCAPTTDKVGFNQRGYWTTRPADPNLLVSPACQ